MDRYSLNELRIPPMSRTELDSLSPAQLAKRMDLFLDNSHSEIYLLKIIPRSSIRISQLLEVVAFRTMQTNLQRESLFFAFEMGCALEIGFRALGSKTNAYCYDSEARAINGWESASVQLMSCATNIWSAVSIRAILDKFTSLIYLLDEQKIIDDPNSKKLAKKILDENNPYCYFAPILIVKSFLDNKIRTPFLHKRSGMLKDALLMQDKKVVTAEEIGIFINHVMQNLWLPLLQIADKKVPNMMGFQPGVMPEWYEKEWLKRYQAGDTEWIRKRISEIKAGQ
jgi:hypothetical protein